MSGEISLSRFAQKGLNQSNYSTHIRAVSLIKRIDHFVYSYDIDSLGAKDLCWNSRKSLEGTPECLIGLRMLKVLQKSNSFQSKGNNLK